MPRSARRRPWLSPFVVVLLVLLQGTASSQTVLRVPQEFDTIQLAVDAATEPGTVVLVSKGTYEEPVSLFGKSDLTLLGKGNPRIVSDSDGVVLDECERVRIAGFTIDVTSGPSEGSGTGVIVDDSSAIVLEALSVLALEEGVLVADTSGAVVRRVTVTGGEAGILLINVSDSLVERCRIDQALFEGISLESASRNVVRRNLVRGGHDGIFLRGSQNVIEENRLVDPAGQGLRISATSGADHNVLRGNLVRRAGGDGLQLDGEGNVAQGNRVVDAQGHGVTVAGTGNALVDNVLLRSGADGIRCDEADHRLQGNRVARAGGDGLFITDLATGLVVTGNRLLRSADDGIDNGGVGALFLDNVARQSGDLDLDHHGDAVFIDNTFGTTNLP